MFWKLFFYVRGPKPSYEYGNLFISSTEPLGMSVTNGAFWSTSRKEQPFQQFLKIETHTIQALILNFLETIIIIIINII